MKVFKQIAKGVAFSLLLVTASTAVNAQSKTIIKKDSVYSTIGMNPIIKDESGKVLTFNEMIALTKTGDYKVNKKLDNNKKPYLLVEKAPGFAPRPESPPIVIRPNKKP